MRIKLRKVPDDRILKTTHNWSKRNNPGESAETIKLTKCDKYNE